MLMKSEPEEINELDDCIQSFRDVLEDFQNTLNRANDSGVDSQDQRDYIRQLVLTTMQTLRPDVASQVRQQFIKNSSIPGHWVNVNERSTNKNEPHQLGD